MCDEVQAKGMNSVSWTMIAACVRVKLVSRLWELLEEDDTWSGARSAKEDHGTL